MMDGWIYYYHLQYKNNVVAILRVNTGTNQSNINMPRLKRIQSLSKKFD